MPLRHALVAEWPSGLGKGLQSPVHGFDSRLRLFDCHGKLTRSTGMVLDGAAPPVSLMTCSMQAGSQAWDAG